MPSPFWQNPATLIFAIPYQFTIVNLLWLLKENVLHIGIDQVCSPLSKNKIFFYRAAGQYICDERWR